MKLFNNFFLIREINHYFKIYKKYIEFGKEFENRFVNQGKENRDILESLDIGWKLLKLLPKSELDRIDDKILNKYFIDN